MAVKSAIIHVLLLLHGPKTAAPIPIESYADTHGRPYRYIRYSETNFSKSKKHIKIITDKIGNENAKKKPRKNNNRK